MEQYVLIATTATVVVMAIMMWRTSRAINLLRKEIAICRAMLGVHNSWFSYARDLLVVHHLHHYPDEDPTDFIWEELGKHDDDEVTMDV